MKKELKDYLHLYLGCDGEIRHGEIVKLTTTILHQSLNPVSGVDFKPILRPLSDMTEEEQKEFRSLNTTKDWKEQCEANNTLWLLSKHFDLFNLITDGLAIDKTKLNSDKEAKECDARGAT